jgi:hypothetical protein
MQSALPSLPLDALAHWFTLALALFGTLAVGICVHELLHLVPLHLADADYAIRLLPESESTGETGSTTEPTGEPGSTAEPTPWASLQNALTSGLVRVEVTHVRPSTPEWVLRVAALLPLALALPLVLVGLGVVPDPITTGDHLAAVVLIAVTGCGLPSPADWSVVWHGMGGFQNE